MSGFPTTIYCTVHPPLNCQPLTSEERINNSLTTSQSPKTNKYTLLTFSNRGSICWKCVRKKLQLDSHSLQHCTTSSSSTSTSGSSTSRDSPRCIRISCTRTHIQVLATQHGCKQMQVSQSKN